MTTTTKTTAIYPILIKKEDGRIGYRVYVPGETKPKFVSMASLKQNREAYETACELAEVEPKRKTPVFEDEEEIVVAPKKTGRGTKVEVVETKKTGRGTKVEVVETKKTDKTDKKTTTKVAPKFSKRADDLPEHTTRTKTGNVIFHVAKGLFRRINADTTSKPAEEWVVTTKDIETGQATSTNRSIDKLGEERAFMEALEFYLARRQQVTFNVDEDELPLAKDAIAKKLRVAKSTIHFA